MISGRRGPKSSLVGAESSLEGAVDPGRNFVSSATLLLEALVNLHLEWNKQDVVLDNEG